MKNNKKDNKKDGKKTTVLLIVVFFVGLSVMLYPTISNYWNQRSQSKAIIDYEKMLASIEPEDYTAYFEAADSYNEKLSKLAYPLIEFEKVDGYDETLDVTGTGMMGYLTIDKINLELPVYHGTEDSVLSIAVGHLKGTSFPVGGESTHSVVSAHRGLPTATLFTNLDHMEIGDTFYFTILDKVITYQVDQIKVVEPEEVNDIVIVDGEDYCTLLTCTPYGINTERLLVRGKRIESIANKSIHITSDATQIDPLIITPIVAMPILLVLLFIVLFKPIKKESLGED